MCILLLIWLIAKNDNTMVIPVKDECGEILFNGVRYTMQAVQIERN